MMTQNNKKNNNLRSFILLSLGMIFIIYIQSYFFHYLPKPFCYIDLATIALICIFFEQSIFMSILIAVIAGSTLDSLSIVKPGFFMLYYFIAILIVKNSERFFNIEIVMNKFLVFLPIFFLKFIFIYLSLDTKIVSLWTFLSTHYGQFLTSSAFFFVFIGMIKMFESAILNSRYSNRSTLKRFQ